MSGAIGNLLGHVIVVGGWPRASYRPARVIDDFAYAVDHLMSRSDIDPQRVAVVGVCMGGGYAELLAAQEKRIRAVSPADTTSQERSRRTSVWKVSPTICDRSISWSTTVGPEVRHDAE